MSKVCLQQHPNALMGHLPVLNFNHYQFKQNPYLLTSIKDKQERLVTVPKLHFIPRTQDHAEVYFLSLLSNTVKQLNQKS